ncbi:MAG: hypothetical protein ACLSCV_08455 [Acutalibacteraceae bacterium]
MPGSYKEGALARSRKFRVIMGIVLPCAMPGVLTGHFGMGRIVGESALLFT